MDMNLLSISCESPLYISLDSKQTLVEAIAQDTELLNRFGLMDYSLLLGVDADRNELVIGIIDYLRTFTWDKKVETVLKAK